jgi:hypothetical protein
VTGDDWETVATVLVALSAAAGVLVQLARPRARANLKTDLEILKGLDPKSNSYDLLQEHVDREVQRLYEEGPWLRALILSGLTMVAAGVGLFIFALVSNGAWWWYLIAAFLVIAGWGGLIDALSDRRPAAEDRASDSTSASEV